MLEVRDVEAGYGPLKILNGVTISVAAGQVVGMLGGNGSGKSTMIKTIVGLIRSTGGTIDFAGERIDQLPSHDIFARGIALSPQYRELFKEMSVAENLELGFLMRGPKGVRRRELWEKILSHLPALRARLGQKAGSLSGGEQQMLATARALASEPKLLILDEPTAGLSPIMVAEIISIIRRLKANGQTILLVEQNVRVALEVSDFLYGLRSGRVEMRTERSFVREPNELFELYLS